MKLEEGEAAWHRLLDRLPSVKAQFAGARATLPFVHAPRVAFRSRVLCGDGWAMLPSAAGVIDPLLSTGFPLTLLGVGRLVDLLERTWDGPGRGAALDEYAQQTQTRARRDRTPGGGALRSMNDFDLFKRLTRLYFAAASFSETARRLGQHELAPGFLLCDHPTFGPGARAIADGAMLGPTDRARANLLDEIDRTIEPFDIAGLGDDSRRDWYPVLAEDLIAGRDKLGATRARDRRVARTVRLSVARDCRLQIADCRLKIPRITRG